MNVQPPSCGRIVHYTLSEVDSPRAVNRVRPAVVIDVVDGTACNLHVMTNGGRDDLSLVHWKGEVQYSEAGEPGTWHWPPFVPPKDEKREASKPAQQSLGGLIAKEKEIEKPVTDRYAVITDVAPVSTKPESLPFAEDPDDNEEMEDSRG